MKADRPALATALESGQADDIAGAAADAGDDRGAADDEVGHGGHLCAHGGHAVLVAQPLPLGRPRHVVQLELVPLVPAREVTKLLQCTIDIGYMVISASKIMSWVGR